MEGRLMWELLPEEFPYEDKGCEMFPSCLSCPFPHCLEEEPRGKQKFSKRRRAGKMMELRREGKSVAEIAGMFKVSPRTVQRALKAVEAGSSSVVARSPDRSGRRSNLVTSGDRPVPRSRGTKNDKRRQGGISYAAIPAGDKSPPCS